MSLNLQANLNQAQLQAVTFTGGPLLILAGAGSGKTRALTYRAAYLIHDQAIDPANLLLLTFTNKAAEEMQTRLSRLIGTQVPFAGTFHRFCATFLRKEGKYVGISPNFIIYDDQDQLSAVKLVMGNLGISVKDFKPRSILSQISQAKNELLSPEDFAGLARGPFQEAVAQTYHHYQRLLRQNHALDFDDLLLQTLRLLSQLPHVAHHYQQRFQHILVDEYQDTNKAQYQIAKILAQHHRQITAVGDASQSIYRWRGADYRNLEYLRQDFPDLTVIKLEQNYRSTQPILDAAHSVIKHNRSHPVLHLWTQQKSGDLIRLYQAADEQQEAQYVINSITQSSTPRSSAVLYRTNAQSRAFEEVCIRQGIPYILVGGVKFYQRQEIKDLLSYLRLLVNPTEPVSLQRAQKLGKRRLQNFFAQTRHLSITTTTTEEIFKQVLSATGYLERFNPKDEADLSRIENIKELQAVTTQFESLLDFLENVSLVENQTEAANQHHRPIDFNPSANHPPVVLMTIHASKGLEFDQVFVVGLEEGLFPHSRSLLDPAELEEERRLCYVALTRAKSRLHLTYAQSRLYFGGHLNGTVSRFISEIPPHLFHPNSTISSSANFPSTAPASISDDLIEKFLSDEIDIDQLIN